MLYFADACVLKIFIYMMICSMHVFIHKLLIVVSMWVSTKEGRGQESIQSSTTPDPGYQWEINEITIRHHKREPEVSPFSAGDHKATISRCARKHTM